MRFVGYILLSGLLFFSCQHGEGSNYYEAIKEGFTNPPVAARPKVYWWWLNGNVDTTRLVEELRAMKEIGVGGVDIFEIGVPASENQNNEIPPGPAFMGDEFLKSLKVVLDEAKRLNMEVGINLASSWNAGGSWTLPQHASKTIYVSKVNAKEGDTQIKIPFPEIPILDPRGRQRVIQYQTNGKPVYNREIAVLAIPKGNARLDTAAIINLTSSFNADEDVLSWKVPAGEWEIHRYVCANSGEQLFMPSEKSVGPIIDHYDSSATRAHLSFFIDKLKSIVGEFSTSAIDYFYLASYEAKDFAWTESLPKAFEDLSGYPVYKFLPALFDTTFFDSGTNKRFQYDFRMALSELMINNHYRKAKEVSNEVGLKIASESGGPGVYTIPVEVLKALGSLDIPRGEFWHRTTRFDKDSVDIIFLVKEIAAASHIYKRGVVEEEAFTSFINDWQEGPHDLKVVADRAFCEGMNRVVIHGFTHNTKREGVPGIGYFAGTHFNPKSGWWSKGKPFIDYLARISHVLQQTDFVADVLYYYGDDVPNLVPPKNTRYAVGEGYDYEIVNKEVLLRELTVEDGKLLLPGVGTYHVLDVGNHQAMSTEVLEKLKQLAEAGAVIVGQKPETVSGLRAVAVSKMKAIVNELWTTSNDFSKKNKIHSQTAIAALQFLKVKPDLLDDSKAGHLDYIHYKKSELDFYLVRNTTNKLLTQEIQFRQFDKAPELWNPVTGEISKIPFFKQNEDQINLPLSLPPHGAMLICFNPNKFNGQKNGANQASPLTYTNNEGYSFTTEKALTNSWTVTFPKGWGAPDSITLSQLQSLTQHSQPGIQYFSGTATYTTYFERPTFNQGERVVMNLGSLNHVAEVWLNDTSLGVMWTHPYAADITNLIKPGDNQLRVAVTNNWSNRLAGDAILGEHYASTNIKVVNREKKLGWDKTPLIAAGLFGPVTIQTWQPIIETEK